MRWANQRAEEKDVDAAPPREEDEDAGGEMLEGGNFKGSENISTLDVRYSTMGAEQSHCGWPQQGLNTKR